MDELDDLGGAEDFSMEDLEKDLKKGRGGRRWLWFLIGLGVGVAGVLVAPRFLAPYLPEALRGRREILSGPVLAEEVTDGRVLLTIQTEPGALIASFSERVNEIAMLVDPGDIVTIAVDDYEPFIENPDFEGVKKGGAAGSDEHEADDMDADEGDPDEGATEPDGPADAEGPPDGETGSTGEAAEEAAADTTAGRRPGA